MFRKVIADTKERIDNNLGFLTESKEDALKSLDMYLQENSYALPSTSIDMVLINLARVLSFNIKVHYRDIAGFFDTHLIQSGTENSKTIEVALLHGHYDLIIKRKSIKDEAVPEIFSGQSNFASSSTSSTVAFGSKKKLSKTVKIPSESEMELNSTSPTQIEWEEFCIDGMTLTNQFHFYSFAFPLFIYVSSFFRTCSKIIC